MLRRFPLLSIVVALSIVILACGACQPAAADAGVSAYRDVARPYLFNFATWEWAAFSGPNNPFTRYPPANVYDADTVRRYLDLVAQETALNRDILGEVSKGSTPDKSQTEHLDTLRSARIDLEPQVERIIAAQVTMVLHENGIYTPLDRFINLKQTFPKVWFKLDQLPYLLVVSPRNKIESIYEVNLLQELDAGTINRIENQITDLGASGLVVMLGGLGFTYPAFVANETDLDFLMHTVTEEWLHQYLAFTPLGVRYVLDLTHIQDNYTIATMNETLASMVAEEIAQQTVARFYKSPQVNAAQQPMRAESFDFNAEMRQIRIHVDELLANGQVDEA
ncbi:MAG: hypothetical protein ACYC6L_16900, partial [Anaerolineae bacterium]